MRNSIFIISGETTLLKARSTKFETWIQPLSATLGFEDLRRGFKSETFSRAFIEPEFYFC
jgi:hypothetical protein